MSTPTTPHDLITVLTEDHREAEELFGHLESRAGETSQQAEDLLRETVTALVQHSVVEEVYLYPTVRKHLPAGGRLADQDIAEHDQIERTMRRLESLTPADTGFWPAVHELIREVRRHVRDEEDDLFPRLRAACPHEDLRALGHKVEQARKVAPTRPHPHAPSEGGRLAAAAAGTGVIDRIRDALSGRAR